MKVSVIIPYNINRGWLSEAVASCEHQEGMTLNVDYEVIVQHGEVTVGTNINRGIEKAKGKYIKWLCEDDRLAPGALTALYDFAESGGYDFVCADAHTFEGNNRIIDTYSSTIPSTVSNLAEGNTIHGGTIMYKRESMPPFNESLWTGEEYELTLRMAATGCKFGKLDEVVYWYRSHDLQKSSVYRYSSNNRAVERFRFIRDVIMKPYWGNRNKIVR